eukprot:2166997-Rhodomonas_salina.3
MLPWSQEVCETCDVSARNDDSGLYTCLNSELELWGAARRHLRWNVRVWKVVVRAAGEASRLKGPVVRSQLDVLVDVEGERVVALRVREEEGVEAALATRVHHPCAPPVCTTRVHH